MEPQPTASRYRFGEYILDAREARLLRADRVLDVQPKVIELLQTFLAQPGHLFTRDDLMRALWPDVHVSDHSLSQVLHKTRQAIGDDTAEATWIQTVHRKGYRFVGAVHVEGEASAASGARDRFIGRQGDLAALEAEWADGVAGALLVGPGGAGKTRLAREHLARHSAPWTHTVDLTGIRSVEAFVGAFASTLGVPLQAADTGRAVDQIGHALDHLGPGRVFVDNLEGVLPAATVHLTRWRALAPQVRWLLTSRVRTEIDGVAEHALAPLDEADAVALFRERASEHAIALGAGWTTEIRQIVRRLEGSPLAIELAAARTPMLDPAAIRDRLDRQLALLGTPRAGDERHASMRAVVAWSWDLATEHERAALTDLAVFPGTFTVPQAERVVRTGEGAPPLLDLLEALADRFLVEPGTRGVAASPGRLRLPPPVREFALEHLPLDAPAQGRFVAAMRARCDDAQAITDRWDPLRHAGLMDDLENLRAALDLCGADPATRARLGVGLAQVLLPSIRAVEAREILAPLAADADLAIEDRDRALLWLATTHMVLGSTSALGPSLEEAARRAVDRGDLAFAFELTNRRSQLLYSAGAHEDAVATAQDAMALAERAGDLAGLAEGAYRAAVPTLFLGRLELGEALVARALAAARAVDDRRLLAAILDLRGALAVRAGRHDDAARSHAEALAINEPLGLPMRDVMVRMNLASTWQEARRFQEALAVQIDLAERYARLGLRMRRAELLVNSALTRLHLGDLDGAEADLLWATANSPAGSQSRVLATMNRAALETLRGRYDAARDLGRACLEACRAAALMASAALLWVVVAEAGRGDLEAAQRASDEAAGIGPVPPLISEAHAVTAALVTARVAAERADAEAAATARAAIARAMDSASHPLVSLVARACVVALRQPLASGALNT